MGDQRDIDTQGDQPARPGAADTDPGPDYPPALPVGESIRVRPGEFLVLSFDGAIHPAALKRMREELHAHFPTVADRILIVGGGARLAVIETEERNTPDA
jgi:hypothetical protein